MARRTHFVDRMFETKQSVQLSPETTHILLRKWSDKLQTLPPCPSHPDYQYPVTSTQAIRRRTGELKRNKQNWKDAVDRWFEECREAGYFVEEFVQLLRAVRYGPWPSSAECHIEFALIFLELRPYIPRSGKTKKILIKRLRSQRLEREHIKRIDALIRREVRESSWSGGVHGVFSEYWRTTAKLNPPGLSDWLEETANGAILRLGISNLYHLYDEIFEQYDKDPYLGPREVLFDHKRGFGWGIEWPSLKIVKDSTGGYARNRGEERRMRHNAWVMLTRANQLREFHNW